jgi:hypothetical protein
MHPHYDKSSNISREVFQPTPSGDDNPDMPSQPDPVSQRMESIGRAESWDRIPEPRTGARTAGEGRFTFCGVMSVIASASGWLHHLLGLFRERFDNRNTGPCVDFSLELEPSLLEQ